MGWEDYQLKTKVAVRTYKKVQNPGERYTRSVLDRQETWETTESDPRPKEQLSKGWQKLDVKPTRGYISVVVASDEGYDYGQFRRNPEGYKPHLSRHSTKGINVHLHIAGNSSHVQFDWDAWDNLVATVNAHRDVVQIAPIAAKIEAELAVEDALQEYIEKKGLRHETPTEQTADGPAEDPVNN